ncbi:MAG: PfkB family carbohydrate kinase [Actinomycetota bacterium]|nr:PfkB family carbohydrate kinase [Actinomycetota bacterium]
MIYTLTLNLNLDLIYETQQLNHDQINRSRLKSISVGGKGINISRALSHLGIRSQALGFCGGTFQSFILERLAGEGIDTDLLKIEGSSRVNAKIIEKQNNNVVEINEYGPCISPVETRAMFKQIRSKAGPGDYLILAGSLPSGMDSHTYGRIIKICHHNNVRVLLDASAEALNRGIKAVPDYLSINMEELENIKLQYADTPSRIARLIGSGIEAILITDGPRKAWYGSQQNLLEAIPPRVEGMYTVGSGIQ